MHPYVKRRHISGTYCWRQALWITLSKRVIISKKRDVAVELDCHSVPIYLREGGHLLRLIPLKPDNSHQKNLDLGAYCSFQHGLSYPIQWGSFKAKFKFTISSSLHSPGAKKKKRQNAKKRWRDLNSSDRCSPLQFASNPQCQQHSCIRRASYCTEGMETLISAYAT